MSSSSLFLRSLRALSLLLPFTIFAGGWLLSSETAFLFSATNAAPGMSCVYALKHRLFLTVFGKKRVWMTNQTNLCLERRRPIVFERVLTPPSQHSATWHPGPWEEQHPSDHTHITTTTFMKFTTRVIPVADSTALQPSSHLPSSSPAR